MIAVPPEIPAGKEAWAEEDRRSRRRFRAYCILAMIAGAATWLVGLLTGALMLVIVGGSVAVAAGCGLKSEERSQGAR